MTTAEGFLAGKPAGDGAGRAPGRVRGRIEEPDDMLAYKDDDDTSWLLPYVDVASLLLAFVILILAMSKVNLHRFEMLSSALSKDNPPPSLESLKERVDATLRAEHLEKQVSTTLDAEGLRVEFRNALLFESGQADITPVGNAVLGRVLAMLPSLDKRYQIAIEGHTDDVPIHTARYKSNWDLSTMRAVNVLENFVAAGIEPRRLSAQGYADTRPATPGADGPGEPGRLAQARSENRRVVIRVY